MSTRRLRKTRGATHSWFRVEHQMLCTAGPNGAHQVGPGVVMRRRNHGYHRPTICAPCYEQMTGHKAPGLFTMTADAPQDVRARQAGDE